MTDLRFFGDIVPDSPFHLNVAAACVSLSLFHARTLPLSLSLSLIPVAPKSSSKHNNRV